MSSADTQELFLRINALGIDNAPYDVGITGLLEAFDIDIKGFKTYRRHFYSIDYFFEHEHLLDVEVFWWVASWVYDIGGSWSDRWLEAFSRGNRLDSHFNQRIVWCNYFPGIKDDAPIFKERFDKFNQERELVVYRTFNVRKGEAVRTGVKKLDNPDALIQGEGSGSSFTLSKLFAYSFLQAHYNSYFWEKYANVWDKEEQLRITKEQFSKEEQATFDDHTDEWEKIISEDCYCCVASYKLKKKDIIMLRATREEEIVANPNSVELIRYDFIRYSQSKGATYATTWINKQREANDKPYFSWQYEESELFDMWINIVKVLYEHPKWMEENIKHVNDRLLEGNMAMDIRKGAVERCITLGGSGEILGLDELDKVLAKLNQDEILHPNLYKELIEKRDA